MGGRDNDNPNVVVKRERHSVLSASAGLVLAAVVLGVCVSVIFWLLSFARLLSRLRDVLGREEARAHALGAEAGE